MDNINMPDISATFIYNELDKTIILREVIGENAPKETTYKIPDRLSVRQVEYVTKELASVVTKSSESIKAVLNLLQAVFQQKDLDIAVIFDMLLGDDELRSTLTDGAKNLIDYLFESGFFQRVSAMLYIREGERLTVDLITSRAELFADAPMLAAVQGIRGFFSLRTNSSNSTRSLLTAMKEKMTMTPTTQSTEQNPSDGLTDSSAQ